MVGASGALVTFGDFYLLYDCKTEHEWKAKDGKLEKQEGQEMFCFPRKLLTCTHNHTLFL